MRATWYVQAEEILDLAGGDEDGRARGEADDHGVRDEVDQHAQPGQAHRELDHSGKKGECQHEADELSAAGLGQRADRGENHDGNRGGRS